MSNVFIERAVLEEERAGGAGLPPLSWDGHRKKETEVLPSCRGRSAVGMRKVHSVS